MALPKNLKKAISRVVSKVTKRIEKGAKNVASKQIAIETAEQIKKRTRLGKGVSESGNVQKLKPLSDTYKQFRAGNVKFRKSEKHGKVYGIAVKGGVKLREKSGVKKGKKAATGKSKEVKTKKAKKPTVSRGVKNLSPRTRPAKSNLTGTGQMLSAVTSKKTKKGFELKIDENKNRNRELDDAKGKYTNKELVEINEENGRRFFSLAKFEKNKLTRSIRKELSKRIKKL